jgi:hypothetical protein
MKAKRNKEENNPSDLLPAWTIGGMDGWDGPSQFQDDPGKWRESPWVKPKPRKPFES